LATIFNQTETDTVTTTDTITLNITKILADLASVEDGDGVLGSACDSNIGTGFRVGCYTFDTVDISNDTATNFGTFVTNATAEYFSNSVKTPFVINATGKIAQAVIQNGTSSLDTQGEIRFGNATNRSQWEFLQRANVGSNITSINLWINGDLVGSPHYPIFETHTGNNPTNGFSYDASEGNMFLRIEEGGTQHTKTWSSDIPDDGQWHMVTIIFDKNALASTWIQYIDGVVSGQFFASGGVFTGGGGAIVKTLTLGGTATASGNAVTENTYNVDDFAIWNGYQLTADDVAELFVEGAPAQPQLAVDLGAITDTTTVLDQVSSSLDSITNQTESDTAIVIDLIQLDITKILADSSTTTDSLILNSTGIFNATSQDIVVVSDSFILTKTSIFNVTNTETATVTDAVITMLTASKELLDIISASDSIIVTFNTTVVTPPSGGGGGGSTSPSNFQRIQGLQIQSQDFQVIASDTIPSEFVITWFGQETVGVAVTEIEPDPDFDTWIVVQQLPQPLDNAIRIDSDKLSIDPTRITNVALQPFVLNVPTIMCNITLDPNVPCFDPILYQIPVDFTFSKGGFPFQAEHIVTVDGRLLVGDCIVFGFETIELVCDFIKFLEENWWWLASIAFVMMVVAIIWKRGGTEVRVVRRSFGRDLQSMSGERIRKRKKFKKR